MTANLAYFDQSRILGGPPQGVMILTVVLAKKAYTSIESEMKGSEVITNAREGVPLKTFRSAELETIYLGRPQPVIIALRCKR